MKSILNCLVFTLILLIFKNSALNAQTDIIQYSVCQNCNSNSPTLGNAITYSINEISSDFGMRVVGTGSKFHQGIDYVPPLGASVLSVQAGTIRAIRGLQGLKYIIVENNDGSRYAYLHIFNSNPPLNPIRSGAFVLHEIGTTNRFAILNLASDSTGYCSEAMDVGKRIRYLNRNFVLTNVVNQGDAIAPVGMSGTPQYHLHISKIENGGANSFTSRTHAVDPWTSIVTTPTTLTSRIRTRKRQGFSGNTSDHNVGQDNWGNIDIIYPNKDSTNKLGRNVFQIEVGMLGALQGGRVDRYSNVVMNADLIKAEIKPELATTWGILESDNYKSYVKINPANNDTLYPHRIYKEYGSIQKDKPGIIPFAYRSGGDDIPGYSNSYGSNFAPYDYFIFPDVYARRHKEEVKSSVKLADVPQSALYNDGVYNCRANVKNIHQDSFLSPIVTFTLDNYKPFLAHINVKSNNYSIYSILRDTTEGTSAYDDGAVTNNIHEIEHPSLVPGVNKLTIEVTASEPLKRLKYSYRKNSGSFTSFVNMKKDPNNPLKWRDTVSLVYYHDCFSFKFEGVDKKDNTLLNIYESSNQNKPSEPVKIPTRKGSGSNDWNNLPTNSGSDRINFCVKGCSRHLNAGESGNRNPGLDCETLQGIKELVTYNSCINAEIKLAGPDFDPLNYLISWTDGAGQPILQYNNLHMISVGSEGMYCYKLEAINDCCLMEGCVEVYLSNMIESSFELTAEITHVCSDLSTNGAIDLNIEGDNGPYKVDWYAQMPPDLDALVQSQTNIVNGSGLEDLNGYKRGTYLVHVIDQNGCSQTATYVIENNGISISEPSPIVICQPSTGEITPVVSGASGSYSFEWSNGEVDEGLYGLDAGTYTVTVTDDGGCSAVQSYVLSNTPSPISFAENFETIPPTTCSSSDGYIKTWRIGNIVGGVYPMTYLWTNGATTNTIGPIPAGFYTLTVTSADGCTAVKEQELRAVEQINITTEQIINPCPGESHGYIAISADQEAIYECEALNITGEFEYFFELTDLPSGTYCIKITSLETECEIEKCYTIVDEMSDGPLMLNGRIRKSCKGENNGGVILTVNGGHSRLGYDVVWDKPQGPPGTYTVVVTDHCGGTATATFEVGEFDYEPIIVTAEYPNINDEDYIIHTIIGGSGSFSYRWEYEQYPNYWKYNANSQKDSHQPSANRFRFTVVDNVTGCSRQVIYDCLTYTPIITHTCPGWNAGTITLNKLYGRGEHTFLWSNGATTKDLVDLGTGTYTVTITSSTSCETTLTIEIKEIVPEIVTPEFTENLGCGWRKECNAKQEFEKFDNNNPKHNQYGQTYIKAVNCVDREVYCPIPGLSVPNKRIDTNWYPYTVYFKGPDNYDNPDTRSFSPSSCLLTYYCYDNPNATAGTVYGTSKPIDQVYENGTCYNINECSAQNPNSGHEADPHKFYPTFTWKGTKTSTTSNYCCPTFGTIEVVNESLINFTINFDGLNGADGNAKILLGGTTVIDYGNHRFGKGAYSASISALSSSTTYEVVISFTNGCPQIRKSFKTPSTIVTCPEVFVNPNPVGCGDDLTITIKNNNTKVTVVGTFTLDGKSGNFSVDKSSSKDFDITVPKKSGKFVLTVKTDSTLCEKHIIQIPIFVIDCPPGFKEDCEVEFLNINSDEGKETFSTYWNDDNTVAGAVFKKGENGLEILDFFDVGTSNYHLEIIRKDNSGNHIALSTNGNKIQKFDNNGVSIWTTELQNFNVKNISDGILNEFTLIGYDSLNLRYAIKNLNANGVTGNDVPLSIPVYDYNLIHQSASTTIGYLKSANKLFFSSSLNTIEVNVDPNVKLKDLKTLQNGNILALGEFIGVADINGKHHDSEGYKNIIFMTYDVNGNLLSSQSVQNYRNETVQGMATKGNREVAYHGKYNQVIEYNADPTLNVMDSCVFVHIVPLDGGRCDFDPPILLLDNNDCSLSWSNPLQDSTEVNLQKLVGSSWINIGGNSSPFITESNGTYRLVFSKIGCEDVMSELIDVTCVTEEPCLEDPIDITYSETENKFLYFYKTNGSGQLVKSEWISPVTYMMVDSFITWSCENITIKDIIVDENLNVYVIGCDPTITNKTRIIKYNWTTKQIIWSQWREKFVYYSTVPYATNGGTSLNIAGYDTYLQRWYIYGYNRSNGSGTTSQQVNYNFSKGTYEGMRYYKENVFTYYSFGSTGTTISFNGTNSSWQQTLSPLVTVREVTILHNEHTVVGGDFTGTFPLDGVVYEAYPYRSVIFIEYDVLGNVLNVKIYKGSKHFVLKSFTTDGYYKFAYTGYTTENLNIGENVLLDLELLANHPDACAHVDGGSLSLAQLRNAIEVHPESVVKFYPNPFTKGINLDIESPQKDVVSIVIINSIGSVMFTTKVDVEAGQNVKYLNEFEQLPSGVYTVKLKSDLMDHTTRVIRID